MLKIINISQMLKPDLYLENYEAKQSDSNNILRMPGSKVIARLVSGSHLSKMTFLKKLVFFNKDPICCESHS